MKKKEEEEEKGLSICSRVAKMIVKKIYYKIKGEKVEGADG